MKRSIRHRVLILALSIFLGFSCGQKKELSIAGKWLFKELSYTASNRSFQDLPAEEQTRRLAEDQKEAAGTIFDFESDKKFQVTPGDNEAPANGEYEFKGRDSITISIFKTGKHQSARFSFPEKDQLRLDTDAGIVFLFTKVK